MDKRDSAAVLFALRVLDGIVLTARDDKMEQDVIKPRVSLLVRPVFHRQPSATSPSASPSASTPN